MTCDEPDPIPRPSDPWLDRYRDFLIPGGRALDFGCGHGHDSRELLDAGMHVVGIDRASERLECARRIAPEAMFIPADITQPLPFDDEIFDLAIASLSLHYFPWETTLHMIREIARVLRSGSVLLCRVNRVGDANFEYGKGNELEPDFFEVEPGRYKRFFSPESLRQALETALEVEEITPADTRRWGKVKRTLHARARRTV